jgi:hypothetical protein
MDLRRTQGDENRSQAGSDLVIPSAAEGPAFFLIYATARIAAEMRIRPAVVFFTTQAS